MNYEKEYRSIVGKLKNALLCTHPDSIKKVIEDVLHESNEGEDEKIRKQLIDEVKEQINNIPAPYCCDSDDLKRLTILESWLTYLEKQKENIEKEYVFRPLPGTNIAVAAEQAIGRAKEGEHLVLAFNGMYTPVSKYDSAKGLVDKYNTYLKEQELAELPKSEDYGIDGLYAAVDILQKTFGEVYGYQSDDGILEHKCAISAVKELYKQSAEWSEEDEELVEELIKLAEYYTDTVDKTEFKPHISWLKDLPNRFALQPKQEWSEED